jgi:hypothetical protein
VSRKNVGSTIYAGTTHEGAPARKISPLLELRRSVMSCLLWEDSFYESGETIASRIARLVAECHPADVAQAAIDARSKMNLRHVPLLLVSEMARHATHRPYVRATLRDVIQRADELSEFMAIYWDGSDKRTSKRRPVPKSVQRGLADAFLKFDAYQLAKYNGGESPIKLRDVLFLAHAKPSDTRGIVSDPPPANRHGHVRKVRRHREGQGALWKQLVEGTLPTPDTWEVALSASKGENKKAVWTRLLEERKLGAFALIRNLRNMTEAGVDPTAIASAIRGAKVDRLLPFRFISAAKHAPSFVDALDDAMLKNIRAMPKWPGTTVVLIDGSGSMDAKISSKSEVTRLECAAGVAIIVRELCDHARVHVFSDRMVQAPSHKGLALAAAISGLVPATSTMLGAAVRELNKQPYDRIIVITDEQSHDTPPAPKGKGYVINVDSNKKGIGYGPWEHIDGWSDRVLDYIRLAETEG